MKLCYRTLIRRRALGPAILYKEAADSGCGRGEGVFAVCADCGGGATVAWDDGGLRQKALAPPDQTLLPLDHPRHSDKCKYLSPPGQFVAGKRRWNSAAEGTVGHQMGRSQKAGGSTRCRSNLKIPPKQSHSQGGKGATTKKGAHHYNYSSTQDPAHEKTMINGQPRFSTM